MLFDAAGKASLVSAISSALSLAQSLDPVPDNSAALAQAIADRDAAIQARDATQALLDQQNARVIDLEGDLTTTTAERNALRVKLDAAFGEAQQLVTTLTVE